jgi:hypothetical protein
MARFSGAVKALRGPFKKLVQQLRVTIKKVRLKLGGPKGPKSRVPRPPTTPRSVAEELAKATGGEVSPNKGGYTVTVPHAARGIVIRVMEHGGGRTDYYRVSVPGKAAYSVSGEISTDSALTHIDITASALEDILSIVARIKGGS